MPVRCVCGGWPEKQEHANGGAHRYICDHCGRAAHWSLHAQEIVTPWNSEIRALKQFEPMKKALGLVRGASYLAAVRQIAKDALEAIEK